MNYIIDCLSSVLGFLMDFFFQGLTYIGYPHLWACIVLYAVVTRLFFLPQKLKSYRGTLLAPVIKREILAVDPGFYEKTNDKDLTVQRASLKKAIYKKYKVSDGMGCLTTLIQFPLLVALFRVVKTPQEFIPSLETLSSASSRVNSIFGVSLSSIPTQNISFSSTEGLIILVPLIIALSNVIKLYPTLKKASNTLAKVISYSMCLLLTVLITWVSATLPIAISLYWLAGDLTYMVFDFFIHKYLSKSKEISRILKYHNEEVEKEALLSQSTDGETDVEGGAEAERGFSKDVNSESAAHPETDEEHSSESAQT